MRTGFRTHILQVAIQCVFVKCNTLELWQVRRKRLLCLKVKVLTV
ncbi:hypothetical protein [Campylobacter troglodytis]|nr:hypothetical protein [Campylobacter troglodytis]